MPLDEQIAALLPPTALDLPPIAENVAAFRAQMRAAGDGFSRPDAVKREDLAAGTILTRLYRPSHTADATLLVFLHGGGWFLGDLETHDALCAHLAVAAGCAILAVNYRLAPEHPFPAGLDDADAAFRWAVEHAAGWGGDPERVAIGGESAGANLAAAVALRRRERGERQPMFQLLIHPLTDMRFVAPSIDKVAGPGITRDFMEQIRAMYLSDADRDCPDASPFLASSHADLAPAIVITAECDPIRDDGEAYALAMAAAGVETLVQRLPGLPHGFLFLPVELSAVAAAFRLLGSLIRRYARR